MTENSNGRLQREMSINNIKKLSMNPHFYSLLIQAFLSGYNKTCDLKLVFMVLPFILNAESREKLITANIRSRIDTLFQSKQCISDVNISGKSVFAGYTERYALLKPYCNEVLIILFSEKKIIINNSKIELIETIDYRNFKGFVGGWMRCAFYLGVIFSKATNDQLSFILGVNIK